MLLLPVRFKVYLLSLSYSLNNLTSGGSSGIGLATAKVLLETGAYVVSGDLNPSPIEHENHSFLKTDVTNWSNLLALFALAKEKHGRVDRMSTS